MTALISKRLYRCDICKKVDYWGDNWVQYGSIIMAEEIPQDMPTMCSEDCKEVFEQKLENGEIQVPVVTPRGYQVTIKGERKGY